MLCDRQSNGHLDVFLSPMKPREKVVTAEDIQNSLYFVHVEQPEDVQLVQSPSFQEPQYIDQRPPSSDGLHASAVHRKPVSNPTPGLPNAPKRKPVPGTLEPVHGFENMQNINAMNTHPSSSGLLAPGYTPRRSFETQYQEERRSLSSPRTPFGQAFPSGTYLTLIRRDPASGAQWNVARIEDPPVLDISSSGTNDAPIKRKTGAPIYIEVTNPGYSKFIHTESPMMPPLLSRGTDASSISRRSVQDHQINDANAPGEVVDPNEDGTFRRRLWMEGAKNFNGGFGHQRLNSYDSNMSGGSPRNSYEGARRDPFGVATPPFLTKENQPYSTIQVSEKQSTFRGYVFMSPWNGRCEFITGTGGSSLKVSSTIRLTLRPYLKECSADILYLACKAQLPLLCLSASLGSTCPPAPKPQHQGVKIHPKDHHSFIARDTTATVHPYQIITQIVQIAFDSLSIAWTYHWVRSLRVEGSVESKPS